jgi:hypothetical protein
MMIAALVLAAALVAVADPPDDRGGKDPVFQPRPDRPPRGDEPDQPPRRADRPDPDAPRPGPGPEEVERQHRQRLEEMRRQLNAMREEARAAGERGEADRAEELTREADLLERKLREMERMGPRPPKPPLEGQPGPPPEEIERLERKIQALHEEAMKAREAGDNDEAERLLREADELSNRLRPPRGEQEPRRELTEEDIDKVLEWLKEYEPETLEKLNDLREREPDGYYHFLREMFGKMMRMEEMRERDPEGFKRMTDMRNANRKIWELAEKYRNTDDEEQKTKLEAQLKQALAQIFDLKQAQHKAEIEQLEKEVAKLKEIYERNQQRKDAIVTDRLKELTGKKGSFDW